MPWGERRRNLSSATDRSDSLQGKAHRRLSSWLFLSAQEARGMLEWLARTPANLNTKGPTLQLACMLARNRHGQSVQNCTPCSNDPRICKGLHFRVGAALRGVRRLNQICRVSIFRWDGSGFRIPGSERSAWLVRCRVLFQPGSPHIARSLVDPQEV
jgi:hypothetical protein